MDTKSDSEGSAEASQQRVRPPQTSFFRASALLNDAQAEEVARYLRTGEHDNLMFDGWPGAFFERAKLGRNALADALVAEVRARTPKAETPVALRGLDVPRFAASKVSPMVRGLFPRSEQQTVLDLLARSVVFLTPDSIESVLRAARWPGTAWDLANLYLGSFEAELLSDDAPNIVGLAEETTSYVSISYFGGTSRFDDFLVHEGAHAFHNCKRETIGLTHTRRREWLLEIDFRKRETFAYACEAYSRILELGNGPAERRALLSELEREPAPQDRVDADEYRDILREAVAARNGWKRILARCTQYRASKR